MAKRNKDASGGWFNGLKAVFGKRPAPPAKTSAPKRLMPDHLVDLDLSQLLSADPDAPVHIVSLREYRYAVGANWDQLRPKIMTLAQSILQRLVAAGAIITPRDDHFLVTFKPQFRAKGPARVTEVCIELGQRLVGAKFKASIDTQAPAIGMAEAKAGQLLAEDGTLDLDQLDALVASAGAIRPEPEPQFQPVAKEPVATVAPSQTVNVNDRQTQAEWEKMERERAGHTQAEWEKLQRERQAQHIRLVEINAPAKKRADPVWVPIETKKSNS